MDLIENLRSIEDLFYRCEPAVRAFVPEEGRFQRLRREAEDLQERYPDPVARPPLFGVLAGVKDIFHVAGFGTRAGSRLPPEALAGPEAGSARLLREAGALILGKTVTTEFAYFAPGSTRNPRNLEHTPGGSSSGSAAAVAAGMCSLALGTQTIGSIIRPAAYCGVVGFKPSFGRVSTEGLIPLSPSLDHVGFFTPETSGAAVAARVLCQDWRGLPDLSSRPVLGIPDGPYLERTSKAGLAHFLATCEHLSEAGYRIMTIPVMPDFNAIYARHYRILASEAARFHADWFAKYGHLYDTKTAELVRSGESLSVSQLSEDLEGMIQLRRELTQTMVENSIDLWISPAATGPAPSGLGSTGDPVMNLPWTQAGLPALNLPAGRNREGLPLGLQVVARWQADEALLAWAGEMERVVN